jgi:hypothetical protein
LLKNRDRLDYLKGNSKKLGRPRAALDVVERSLTLIR